MAAIGNPLPLPRLIAHNQSPVYNKQQQQHKTLKEDRGENIQHHPGLSMKEIPKLSRETSSETNSTTVKNREDIKLEANKTSEQNQKVNILRSEISRLREEMLAKINSLENEMSTRTDPHTTGTSSQQTMLPYKEKSTQTSQGGDKTSVSGPENNLEFRLLEAIDARFQNFRDEIFEKLDAYFNVHPENALQNESKLSRQQHKQKASVKALWELNNSAINTREESEELHQQHLRRRSNDYKIRMARKEFSDGSRGSYEYDSNSTQRRGSSLDIDYSNEHAPEALRNVDYERERVPSTTEQQQQPHQPQQQQQQQHSKSSSPPKPTSRHLHRHNTTTYPLLSSATCRLSSESQKQTTSRHHVAKGGDAGIDIHYQSRHHSTSSRPFISTSQQFHDPYKQQQQQQRQGSPSAFYQHQQPQPATSTLDTKNNTISTNSQHVQTAREEFARHLVDQLFSYDDLADANVKGVKGKRLLDPNKIGRIRDTVFTTYPLRSNESEEYLWKFICDKINAKCRGVTRTLKRKNSIWEVQATSTKMNNDSASAGTTPPNIARSQYDSSGSTLVQPAFKYRKETHNLERCSFVTPLSSSTDFHHTLSRLPSSSDSETSSVDLPASTLPTPHISTPYTAEGGSRSWNLLQDKGDDISHHSANTSITSSSGVPCLVSVSSLRYQNSSIQDSSSLTTSYQVSNTGSRSSSAPVMRSSSVTNYNSTNTNNNKMVDEAGSVKQKSALDEEEEEIEIKVDGEEDDVSVDDDVITEYDRYSNYDRARAQPVTVLPLESRSMSSPPALLNSSVTSQSAFELCDRLAEKYMETFVNSTTTLPEDSKDDGANTELTVTEQKKRIQSNREEFTRTLIEALFTRTTLAHSNVTGARGKFMLDPVKIAKVRDTVFLKFPADCEEEEETVWKILTTKINTKCRGVKRLMKRKGIPAERIANRYQGIFDNINKMKNTENTENSHSSKNSKNFKINNTGSSNGNSTSISSTFDTLNEATVSSLDKKLDTDEHSLHGTISSSDSSTTSMSPTLIQSDEL